MNRFILKSSKVILNWLLILLLPFLIFTISSCSTTKENSYAYLDDIYDPYNEKMPVYDSNYDSDEVSDQDASVIKPYRPAVEGFSPYMRYVNFNVGFYNNYNLYPYRCHNNTYGSIDYYGRRNYYSNYSRYDCDNYYGFNNSYNYNYSGRNYDYYNDGYNNSGSSSSYIYGENVSFFNGNTSSDRKNSFSINYARYSGYSTSGVTDSGNGRSSDSQGKSKYKSGYNSSNSNGSNNGGQSTRSSSQSKSSNSSSGGTSPSRSSGSSGGNYSGKRPK